MSRRRQVLFAAPFVVIAAGCDKPPAKPEVHPHVIDAAVAVAPAPDAAAPAGPITFNGYSCLQGPEGRENSVPCPPELIPEAPPGTAVVESYGEFRAAGGKLVRGPATIVAPDPASIDKGSSHIGFDDATFACRSWEDMSCPQGASCNPPPQQQVACPDNLLPHLTGGVAPTSRKNKDCFLGDVEVACPTDDLSAPDVTSIDDPSGTYARIVFRDSSDDCAGEAKFDCPPDSKCNPPRPVVVPCPDALLPALVNGDKPTKQKDGSCWWKKTQVRCQ